MTAVPIAHKVAGLLGWSRRRWLIMLKAKITIMKNGSGSNAENNEPHHCQYSGVPIQ